MWIFYCPETTMYALVTFDGDALFHNGREMYVRVYFECDSLAKVSKLLRKEKVLRELLDEDYFDTFWQNVVKQIRAKDPTFPELVEIPPDHEDLAMVVRAIKEHSLDCVPLLTVSGDISAYAIIDCNETLFQILKAGDLIDDFESLRLS